MSKSDTRRMVLAALTACEEKKAEDIRVLELDPADAAFTDFFLICSGANGRQNQAIAQEIELRLKREFGAYAHSVEGYRQAEWILLDYVDFVIHIFAVEQRAAYNIERLRKTANSVTLEELKKSLVEKVAAARKKTRKKTLPAKSAVSGAPPKTVKKTARTAKKAGAKAGIKLGTKAGARKAAKKRMPAAKPRKLEEKKASGTLRKKK
jgi:ribosome-associated protein